MEAGSRPSVVACRAFRKAAPVRAGADATFSGMTSWGRVKPATLGFVARHDGGERLSSCLPGGSVLVAIHAGLKRRYRAGRRGFRRTLVGPRLTLGKSEAVEGLLINIGASNAEQSGRQTPNIVRSLISRMTSKGFGHWWFSSPLTRCQ